MDFNTHNNNQTNTNNKMECSDSDSESDDYEDLEIPDHMSRAYHVGPVTNLETLTFSDHVAEFMEVPGSDTEPNEIIEIKSNDSAKDTPNNQLFLITEWKMDGMKFTNTRHVNDIDSTEIDSNDDNIDNIYNLTTDNITVNGIKYMLKQDKYTKVTERRNVFCVTINKKSGFVAKVFPCCDMKACKAVKREWDMLVLLKNNINTINPCLVSLYNPCMEEPNIVDGIIITQRFGINMVKFASEHRITEAYLVRMNRQLINGMKGFHNKGLILFDMYPANILYDYSKTQWKLCDFGLIQPIHKNLKLNEKYKSDIDNFSTCINKYFIDNRINFFEQTYYRNSDNPPLAKINWYLLTITESKEFYVYHSNIKCSIKGLPNASDKFKSYLIDLLNPEKSLDDIQMDDIIQKQLQIMSTSLAVNCKGFWKEQMDKCPKGLEIGTVRGKGDETISTTDVQCASIQILFETRGWESMFDKTMGVENLKIDFIKLCTERCNALWMDETTKKKVMNNKLNEQAVWVELVLAGVEPSGDSSKDLLKLKQIVSIDCQL